MLCRFAGRFLAVGLLAGKPLAENVRKNQWPPMNAD
jgi:hypothetical protein